MRTEYSNYLFDFDGTIALLDVDWKLLKFEINQLCNKYQIATTQPFNLKVDQLKIYDDPFSIIQKYESPDTKINLKEIYPNTIHLIQNVKSYFIVSNNLHHTVKSALNQLGILNKCQEIIGIDNVTNSKPHIESFLKLKTLLSNGPSLYIGDRETDQEYAIHCGVDYMHPKELM